jgi:hypothetical protein
VVSLSARERHDALFQVLSHNDIQHWADRFLAALGRESRSLSQLEQMPLWTRGSVAWIHAAEIHRSGRRKTQGNDAAVCSRPGALNSDDYFDVHEWLALGDPLMN